jgi:peptidyl-tRNA hydrolase, PTH1 family
MPILIVGLGNPGDEYTRTRHNAGFLAIDSLAEALQEKWKLDKPAQAEVIETQYFNTKIILAKPQTFMNLSGKSVASLAHRFQISPEHVWIISDDVALPLGTVRVRSEGSAGGHNGLKSVIESLSSENFVRFRIGVNPPPENIPLEKYVLQKFSKAEQDVLQNVIIKTRELVLNSVSKGVANTSA